jgi:hypothetical protein
MIEKKDGNLKISNYSPTAFDTDDMPQKTDLPHLI